MYLVYQSQFASALARCVIVDEKQGMEGYRMYRFSSPAEHLDSGESLWSYLQSII